ncbi:SDR family NAD(P)-dependent oxidoreductase [Algirhabdus cladophorae]|uniref:SDR family NAD(P)-dependent oxidoreductase n=1 Tax=Algirhabdus cladophorae TaxID=3377108 RepID=UPI003B845272
MPQFARYPSLEGAVVYLTGGAGGIGADMVRAFCDQGAQVAFFDFDAAGGAAMAAETGAIFKEVDLRDIPALQEAMAEALREVGTPDVLVNNAARDDRHGWETVTPEYYDERIATNLKHMFFATQAVAPAMQAAGKGSIINMGSNSWWEAGGGMPVYTTSKAAVHGMTRSFARDLGPDRIRVNTVVPGWIMTDRQKELWVTEESLANHLNNQCLKDPIAPEYVTRMVLFLASDDAAMCTANNYMVEGGSI